MDLDARQVLKKCLRSEVLMLHDGITYLPVYSTLIIGSYVYYYFFNVPVIPSIIAYQLQVSGSIFQNQYLFLSNGTVSDNCIMKLSVLIYTMYFCIHQARKNSSVQQLSLYFLLISVLSATVIIHQLTPALAETKGSNFMPSNNGALNSDTIHLSSSQ